MANLLHNSSEHLRILFQHSFPKQTLNILWKITTASVGHFANKRLPNNGGIFMGIPKQAKQTGISREQYKQFVSASFVEYLLNSPLINTR